MSNQHTVKRPVRSCACGDHAWLALTRGYVALISPEDADFIGRWSWSTLVLTDGKLRAVRRENASGKTYYMHREILDAGSADYVDHRNAQGLDNRRKNIRLCTPRENVTYQRPRKTQMSSRFKGVYHDRGRGNWQAYINHKGKRRALGRFPSEDEAARAYDKMAVKLHGEFALTNETLGLFAKP